MYCLSISFLIQFIYCYAIFALLSLNRIVYLLSFSYIYIYIYTYFGIYYYLLYNSYFIKFKQATYCNNLSQVVNLNTSTHATRPWPERRCRVPGLRAYIYIYMYIHTYIYNYNYTYTHTYTYTYTFTCAYTCLHVWDLIQVCWLSHSRLL